MPTTITTDSPPLPGCHALTQEQKEAFARNGFIILPQVLSDTEIEQYLRVVDEADRVLKAHFPGERPPGDPLELRNAVTFSTELLDLITHPAAFPYILDLMGPAIALTTSHMFIRPPSPPNTARSHKQIAWHRDGPLPRPHPVSGVEPWLYTKIGYFLTDTTIPDAGALRVVPGSHRYGGAAPQLPGEEEPHGAIEVQLKPGDAVIFENRVMHAVGPNYSNISRKNLYYGYCWQYLRPIDYIQQPPELLEQANEFQRQLLGDNNNPLGFYLPKARPNGLPLERWANQSS